MSYAVGTVLDNTKTATLHVHRVHVHPMCSMVLKHAHLCKDNLEGI